MDVRLTRFFNSGGFVRLAISTKKSYTADYRVLLNFLWARGIPWAETTQEDFEDFEDWRRRSPENPRRVSGAKWGRELAAFKRLFDWAANERILPSSPLAVRSRFLPSGRVVEVLEAAPRDVRSANVKWLTPDAFVQWRDVGLRGYTAEGLRAHDWRGRNDDRNSLFADLLFDSGLRRTEASSLLLAELPRLATGSAFQWSNVSQAVSKSRRRRAFNMRTSTLRAVQTYVNTTRAEAVRRGQARGLYTEGRAMRVVLRITDGYRQDVTWRDPSGTEHREAINNLSVAERQTFLIEKNGSLEPWWLWLSESGEPFQVESWENVFRAANVRARDLIGEGAPFCRPHMLRHTFALLMLVALMRAMDDRYGLSPAERRDFEMLYGDPWRLVQNLLGHRDAKTTEDIYLAPVSDIQLRTLLQHQAEPAEFLWAHALRTGLVQGMKS
ncbi:tyrosine-type recombinase/integrase [Cryobacterium sp. PAMC25264]|uniref:tyrosine-type recombinase/integrase n=1 Tax=Cryobacterium sp. PAMC25264 TaxID=2861288 RepID=UPI001C63AA3E|nr:tyrosine-type recombinase/integrase [Cryobacterium sp. PAMC25264]QYF74754.1 tyrosine-type recombinase/integrase [Cryobacterium sp. PAMC25264]